MRSLKGRLIAVAALWVVGCVAIAGTLLSAEFRTFLIDRFYDELHEHLDEFVDLMEVGQDGKVTIHRPLSDPRFSEPLSGYYWEVHRREAIAARSSSLEGPILDVPADHGANAEVHHHTIMGPTGPLLIAERFRWINGEKDPIRIIIGVDKRHLDEVLDKFNGMLMWYLGTFSLSMIAVALVLLWFAMAPFNELRAAVANYRTGATPNVRGKFPDEVQPLIDDLNSLVAESGEQVMRARAQAGNIAHSLKTPLAILVDEADRLAQSGQEAAASVIREQCRRMQGQIDYQIARTRAAASRAKPGLSASLSDVADAVVRALGRLHVERRLAIENEIPAGLRVACEAQDLNEMLANLVDNACKHARGKVRLRVDSDSPASRVRLIVEDDGPGLPPEAWGVVFNIGEQWGSRAGGSGLGLPIVRDIVQLYGGSIRLDQSDLGGLKAVLDLPKT
jgi:signal transduction histidine kinase